jgi:hypothetical protein
MIRSLVSAAMLAQNSSRCLAVILAIAMSKASEAAGPAGHVQGTRDCGVITSGNIVGSIVCSISGSTYSAASCQPNDTDLHQVLRRLYMSKAPAIAGSTVGGPAFDPALLNFDHVPYHMNEAGSKAFKTKQIGFPHQNRHGQPPNGEHVR